MYSKKKLNFELKTQFEYELYCIIIRLITTQPGMHFLASLTRSNQTTTQTVDSYEIIRSVIISIGENENLCIIFARSY